MLWCKMASITLDPQFQTFKLQIIIERTNIHETSPEFTYCLTHFMLSPVNEHHMSSSRNFQIWMCSLTEPNNSLANTKLVSSHNFHAFLSPLLPQGSSSCHQSAPASVSLNAAAKDTHMRNPTAQLELYQRLQLTGQSHEPTSTQCSPPAQLLGASRKSHQPRCPRTHS